jgi:aspartyl/asparaginyl beta-hydroxylase (cupin superfamily)
MPIVTTEQSAIRVADDTYEWQYGHVFGFDDAFDHESWNDSDEPRVNLLFEAWHPGLTEHEKGAIAASFDARESWNHSRRI